MTRNTREQWLPATYLIVAALVALLVFPTALRPPADEATTSAEFSPDAPPEDQTEAIIESLQHAGSRTAGSIGQGTGDLAPPTQPPGTTVFRPGRNACWGDPPRQIESVYSPSCTSAFVGDNGGATSFGVTSTEIRVAFGPDLSGTAGGDECGEVPETPRDGEGSAIRTYRVLRNWFNQNLELYGRKLRFFYACAEDGTSGEEAAASKVVKMKGFKAFGAIGEFDQTIPREARRNGIVYMGNIVVAGDTYYRNLYPFVWGSRAHSTRAVNMSGEYLCRRLHRNLPFATGDQFIDYSAPRTFGMLALADATSRESVDLMIEQMDANCGAKPEVVAEYNLDDNAQGIASAMLQLCGKTPRPSTIIFMGEILTLPAQAEVANEQQCFPEWYVMGAGGFETAIILARSISPRQWQNAFGFSFEEIPRRPRSTPCYRAYRSLDPENDPNNSVCEILFHSMLFMFGAMQEAGPNLTPETWSKSLEVAFTRPATPEWSMSGGFTATDYTYGDFAVELYWDPLATHPDGQPGAYVYLNDGVRFLAEDIPRGQPEMFEGGITDGDRAGPDGNAFK